MALPFLAVEVLSRSWKDSVSRILEVEGRCDDSDVAPVSCTVDSGRFGENISELQKLSSRS